MSPREREPRTGLPRLAAALLRLLLPPTERDEVLGELAEEHRARVRSAGARAARRWIWRQTLASVPALARRAWWRGWSGFEPGTDPTRPGEALIEGLARDVRFGLRRLRNRPSFSALTVLTLALGVGGTAAVWGIARPLLLAPLPIRAEEEVVVFWNRFDWKEAELAAVRPEMEGFRSVAAYRPADVTLQLEGAPARLVPGVAATWELFDVLGVGPARGAAFGPQSDAVGSEPLAVLSHALWQELGADPGILGERLELAGVARTVVGVMPAGFWFPDPSVRVWLSQPVDPDNYIGRYAVVGRVVPGTTAAASAVHVEHITTLLGERFTYPAEWDKTRNAELTPIREYLVGPVRPALLALLGAMVGILLVACVNVATLMLGQVEGRGTELAVQRALGAERGRLLRGVLVESLLIGVLAGGVAAGLAVLGHRFLLAALPLGALAEAATLDWSLFGAAVAVALVASMAVALVPAAALGRGDLQPRLARSRTRGVAGRGGRLESALVVAQAALVLLMTSGAALLIRSVGNLRAIDTGIDARGVAVVDLVVPATVPVAQRPLLVRELAEVVAALPGVSSAGAAQPLPLRNAGNNWGITVEGRPELGGSTTYFRVVTPDYFETMGIRLRSGRGLLDSDRAATEEGVVVVNRALADRYFPGTDPIGQRIAFMQGRWDRIVGVVENVAEGRLTDEPAPARYMLYEHVPLLRPEDALVIRVEAGQDPTAVLEAARRAVQEAHPSLAVQGVTTMARVLEQALGPARQVMALLTLLGALALALGVVGVYGVVSHLVARRRRDWAVRIALGMRPVRVLGEVVARAGALVLAGTALGLAGSMALARLLASFLYDVGPADPFALAGASAVLLAAGALAAWLPARRASRTDPVLALKDE